MTSGAVSERELALLRDHIESGLPQFLTDLETLVNIDCGSHSKAGVDEAGAFVAGRLAALGADVVAHPDRTLGSTIVGSFRGRPGAPRLLMLGHLDTVFPERTVAQRPFRIRDAIATGPGVTDMKSGLLAGLAALDALRALGDQLPFERLTFVANADEEIGSPVSAPIIRELAAAVDACLSLECARANGDLVSARKGIVDLTLTVTGRAAHAGVEPEKGRSAILAAAHLVTAIHALNGRWPGVTANVGVIAGGIRPNVVAETCTLAVDIRAMAREHLEAAEREVARLAAAPAVPDTTVTIAETNRHWPMERLPRSVRLIEHAQEIAKQLGFEVRDAATGGAGDANTTAGMGVPTLDGLGPIGGNDHAPGEYLEVDSIVPRTALLAGLLLAVGRDPEIARWRTGVTPTG